MKRKISVILALGILLVPCAHAEARKASVKASTVSNSTAETSNAIAKMRATYNPESRQELSDMAQTMRTRLNAGIPTDLELMKPWLEWRR